MAKLIIALVGPIASGKGLTQEYISKNYQASSFKFSSPLRSVLDTLQLEPSRENLQHLSLDLRNRFGKDLLAKIIAHSARLAQTDVVVIDGVRRLADISELLNLPEFKLISIEANSNIRHKRVCARNENSGDKDKTLTQFESDEKRESERDIKKLSEISHYKIINEADIDSLYRQIDNIFAKIKTYGK